jgi:hypothetical protein
LFRLDSHPACRPVLLACTASLLLPTPHIQNYTNTVFSPPRTGIPRLTNRFSSFSEPIPEVMGCARLKLLINCRFPLCRVLRETINVPSTLLPMTTTAHRPNFNGGQVLRARDYMSAKVISSPTVNSFLGTACHYTHLPVLPLGARANETDNTCIPAPA